MARTVVGLFKSATEAQNIKHELVNEGYSAENIRVVANDGDGSYAGSDVQEARTTGSSDTGVMASIKNFFHSFTADDSDQQYYSQGVNRGGAIVAVTVADERADAVAGLLEQYGAANVNEENTTGAAAGTTTTARGAGASAAATSGTAIPVVEEELQVGKRQVQRGGVRVYSHVVETPVEEEVRLREEHIRIQRNAVNRPATEADFQAFKEGTVELTETAEEAVVSKQARVVEEVTVGKEVSERNQKVKDTVRRTEVDVEEVPGETLRKSATTTNK
jgi:uncharacterized protein (TIGR02271 family)